MLLNFEAEAKSLRPRSKGSPGWGQNQRLRDQGRGQNFGLKALTSLINCAT